MAKQTGSTDLLTLAMRRAHAEAAAGREPEAPPNAEDASAADAANGHGRTVHEPLLVEQPA